MTKKRGLGRGLGALIPTADPEQETAPAMPETGLTQVALAAIQPNPRQPRRHFDEAALAELAASIGEHGLIQPLIVQTEGNGRYTLIAGERRWRAAQLAGLTEVPVVVKDVSSQDMLELALIENIQRADLNPLEEALAYQQLMNEFGLTQERVAERVGKSRPAVANTVRLLDLPENIQAAVVDGKISGAHGRTLLPLPTGEMQTAVMNSVIQQELSVRQTEAIVRKLLTSEPPQPKATPAPAPELTALESQFRQSLGTRVNIEKGAKGGKVVIHFYSDEELQAIYDAIVKE
jgi:ParB family transcriptional regulator, chromosome partitioning protein